MPLPLLSRKTLLRRIISCVYHYGGHQLHFERLLVLLDRLEERVEVPFAKAPAAPRLLLLPGPNVPLAAYSLDNLQEERRPVPCKNNAADVRGKQTEPAAAGSEAVEAVYKWREHATRLLAS